MYTSEIPVLYLIFDVYSIHSEKYLSPALVFTMRLAVKLELSMWKQFGKGTIHSDFIETTFVGC